MRIRKKSSSEGNLPSSPYQKKGIFGPAKTELTELEIEGMGELHLAEAGSIISVDGITLETVDIHIDSLYGNEELPTQDGNP